MTLDRKKKYGIVLIAFWVPWLGLLAAGFGLSWIPQSRQVSEVQTQFAQMLDQAELARLASLPETLPRQHKEKQELADRVEQFTIAAEKQDQLIFQISQLANEMKLQEYMGKVLRDEQTAPSPSADPKALQRISMSIHFSASFPQFAQFINKLECHDPIVLIESASIDRSYNTERLHRAQMLISFLVLPEQQTPKQTAALTENQNPEPRKAQSL